MNSWEKILQTQHKLSFHPHESKGTTTKNIENFPAIKKSV